MCPNLFFVKGSQPQEEYSRCGRHKLVDNQKRVPLIMPICFLALLMSSAIWFENFRSNCSITPKYLQWLMGSTKVYSGSVPKGWKALHYPKCWDCFWGWKAMILHKLISHVFFHMYSVAPGWLEISFHGLCCLPSCTSRYLWQRGQSSSLHEWLLICTRNHTGPNTESCGTPDVTSSNSDLALSNTTVCDLLHRKSCIQFSKSFYIPKIPDNFWIIIKGP